MIELCDAINDWFRQICSTPDANGRIGNHPHRIEGEAMELQGYVPFDATPWEDASGGKAVVCVPISRPCSAKYRFTGAKGYDIDVEYFDQNSGVSKYRLLVGIS